MGCRRCGCSPRRSPRRNITSRFVAAHLSALVLLISSSAGPSLVAALTAAARTTRLVPASSRFRGRLHRGGAAPSSGLITRSVNRALCATTSNMAAPSSASHSAAPRLRFADTGANLLDDRYLAGTYRGQHRHDPDIHQVLERAAAGGVDRVVLTAGTLAESRAALAAARDWTRHYEGRVRFHSTVGVHPTRCRQEFLEAPLAADAILAALLDVARDGMADGTVVAVGELGLDYDRLEFCPKDVQQRFLVRQLEELARPTGLPLFLHNRSVGRDLVEALLQHPDCWNHDRPGVAHSFDDALSLAEEFMQHGFYIGLNGCSLRTEDNLEVVRRLPLDRILLETDCPYCEVRSTHAGDKYIRTRFEARSEKKFEAGKLVKSRQEPCHVVQVAEIVAGCRNAELVDVAEACYQNTRRLFFAEQPSGLEA